MKPLGLPDDPFVTLAVGGWVPSRLSSPDGPDLCFLAHALRSRCHTDPLGKGVRNHCLPQIMVPDTLGLPEGTIGLSLLHKESVFTITEVLFLFNEWDSLISQREFDDQAAHNVTNLKILLRTVGMSIMAGNASMTNSHISINRVKEGLIIDRDCTSDRMFRSRNHCFQAVFIHLIAGAIFGINRP